MSFINIKKSISLPVAIILLFTLVLGVMPTTVFAEVNASGECGNSATYTFDSTTRTLTISGSGAIQDCSSDTAPWSSYRDSIKSIVISEGVTQIGNSAFEKANLLQSVTMPSTITSIGNYAFYLCPALASIELPSNIEILGYGAFQECSSLTTITIPDSVTTIDENAFYDCENLTSVTMQGTTPPTVGGGSFENCSPHLKINVPLGSKSTYDTTSNWIYMTDKIVEPTTASGECYNGVTYTFDNATGTLIISKTSEGSGDMIFCPWNSYAGSIKSVVIENGVTTIKSQAFRNCTNLTSVEIPDSVTSINSGAFDACASLTSITIPDSVTSIGMYTFNGCTSLTSITIPDNVTSIENNVFANCTNLKSVTIPSSVETIGEYAFYICENLESVTMQSTTPPTMGVDMFTSCPESLKIYVPFTSKSAYVNDVNWSSYADKFVPILNITVTDEGTQLGAKFEDADVLDKIDITDDDIAGEDDGNIEISLSFEDKGAEATETEQTAIKDELADGYSIGAFLDISLSKNIAGTEFPIEDTTAPITISFTIPEDVKTAIGDKDAEYKVMRNHNGAIDILNATREGDTITFQTDKFSTYALVYKLTSAGGGVSGTPAPTPTPPIITSSIITPTPPTSSSSSSESLSSSSQAINNPSTGSDDTIFVVAFVLILVAISAVIFTKKSHR
ncbi:MAG: leucine-rich repeat domain-containing protein [Oscillospiraceae bacterium]|nr:leucine-rich repeat domain-containing protein [Oscillospiraceae bacterium]